MDPEAAWERICSLGETIAELCDDGSTDDETIALWASDLADTIAGLEQWIRRGGYCPHCSKEGSDHESK